MISTCRYYGSNIGSYVQVIIDTVIASIFNQCLQACKFMDDKWEPKFTLIVAQKNHRTKFFQTGSPDNVPPGKLYFNLPTRFPTFYGVKHHPCDMNFNFL